ncbi:deoxyuridine 5'-triphosphate nucleotidohydrolase [Clostridium acetireducens DSM 10703]|jgi:dUTP pyrophosphatase|uniref:Deoxyuridine 5'-triphosphate nucleotidohydrolase n=2 Tax=Clostridium TaxID=1485 RepID=A0A1E8F100_9CLOT|nr:deoxyuridine 5'-triphosphate nucleotidohydrolase [Clostridium acetireducens DSM 10703]
MNLKIRKIREDSIIPKYAHKDDAGMDLYSAEDKIIPSGETSLIHTGIQIELPKDTEAQVRPRSGLALKHSITVLNTPGTIDEGFRGEIGVILINHSKKDFKIEKGMRIAQMVIKPVLKVNVVEVDNLTETERGKGGFGSTGIK